MNTSAFKKEKRSPPRNQNLKSKFWSLGKVRKNQEKIIKIKGDNNYGN